MRISTKGRFAVTAMMEVALRERDGPVSLSGIGERQKMSLSYLEQLFSQLRRHGLVRSTRGPGGGYTLGRRAQEITVADIVVAVDSEDPAASQAKSKGRLPDGGDLTGELWDTLGAKMIEFMDAVSLHALVDAELARGAHRPVGKPPARRGLEASTQNPGDTSRRAKVPNSVFAFGRSFAPAS